MLLETNYWIFFVLKNNFFVDREHDICDKPCLSGVTPFRVFTNKVLFAIQIIILSDNYNKK